MQVAHAGDDAALGHQPMDVGVKRRVREPGDRLAAPLVLALDGEVVEQVAAIAQKDRPQACGLGGVPAGSQAAWTSASRLPDSRADSAIGVGAAGISAA